MLSFCNMGRQIDRHRWGVLSGHQALFCCHVKRGKCDQPFQLRLLEIQPHLTRQLISATQITLGEKNQPAQPGLHNGEQIKGCGLEVLHLGVVCYISSR